VTGVVQAIDLPARLAFVMDMVGRDDLPNAVALNSLLFNVARATGPALAGTLLAKLGPSGPGYCFLVNGVSYVPVLLAFWAMDVSGRARVPRGQRSPWAGLHDLVRQPRLAFLVLLAGAVSLCGWPFAALLPALADHTLGVGEQGYSQLLSATGYGALAAAFIVATFNRPQRQRGFIVGAVALVSTSLIGLSLAARFTPAFVACALIGFGLILFFATSQAVVQLATNEHNRGRIMGVWAMVLSGAVPLGNFLTGHAADVWGVPLVLLWQGAACIGFAVVVSLLILYATKRERLALQPSELEP
jgi:predicted MFS family arabinose efflux permease